ncbi:MAG: TylF/MycF/NovP-related O-methyltransferase, partial [Pseudomonadota bacterium]|nr:TylF/MycF/NovP-related O-methyltransferase [Pseudomonadota bacterium]
MLGKFPHHVIPNCIPTEIFKPKERNLIRSHYDLTEKDFVILAGAISLKDERKGFVYLIKALEKLSRNQPAHEITLALYGKIEGKPALPKNIKLLELGYIHNRKKMADSYNLADIFVIPSLEDNLPNTVLEAMACGTPVVGFRTGGIPDMVIPGKTGYLVKQREIDGLVKGIEWSMNLNENMTRTRTCCRNSVLKNFSEKVIAEQYYQLFAQALDRKISAKTLLNNAASSCNKKIELFEQARKTYPFASEILREEALLVNNNGEKGRAVGLLAEALNLNPGDHLSLLSYGALANNSLAIKDFCYKAYIYLDRFPDNKILRTMLSKTQKTTWSDLIKNSSKTTLVNNSNPPLITIIVSLFPDKLSDLNKTLNSLITAAPKDFIEVIIVNFSTDVRNIRKSIAANHNPLRFKLVCLSPVSQKPSVAMAINLGMISGSGRYCINLPAGDQLSDISSLINKLEAAPSIAAAFGDTLLTSSNKNIDWPDLKKLGSFSLLTLVPTTFNYLKHNYSVGPHPLWRRQLYNEFGFWDTRPANQADQDFWIRVSRKKELAYLPTITGKAIINGEGTHNIPRDLKQTPILIRRYRSISADTASAQTKRLRDICRYVNQSYQGLTYFIKDLEDLLQQGNHTEAFDLYDRIRWDMLSTPELDQVDETVLNIRLATFSKPTTFTNNNNSETVSKMIAETDQAIAEGNDQQAFALLAKIKSLKQPIQDVDYRRAEIFIRARQPLTAKQALLEELRYFPNNDKATTLLKQLDQDFPANLEATLGDQFFKNIYRQIRSYTMLSEQRLYSLYKHAKRICEQDIPGNFIECGVAAGGSSALLAATIKKYSKQIRRLFAFDSFSGMPKPGKYDTASGVTAEDTGWGTGTCAAPEESVRQICRQLNVNTLVITVKGYFAETLPPSRDRVGMIAFLHLDGDWY